jgi:1,4-dihydroxy-2-naphthoate octaprenyltransferase
VRIWVQAVRYRSFTASITPIAAGSALALVERSFDWLLFVVMLVAAVACHAGSNLANDFFDHRKGVDSAEAPGSSKVIQQGLLSAEQVRNGVIAACTLATLFGLYIVYRTGWPVLILALVSLAGALLYTGGPWPLGYIALGEITVFLLMGPAMVCGAYYVHTGEVTWTCFLLSLPIACLVAAHLHCNNIRDMAHDLTAGKLTLANVLGRAWANREYILLIAGCYVTLLLLVAWEPSLWPLLGVLFTLPVAMRLIRVVTGNAGVAELNQAMRKTAGLHLRVGVLLTIGLLVRAGIDRYLQGL